MGVQSIKINNKTEVLVASTIPDDVIEGPVYATNWFNLNRPWLYNVYAKLAFSHVVKVGARVLFKGAVTEVLLSDEILNREQLLIVRYPSPQKFLGMLSSKLFLLKSILRLKSVRDFTFGFGRREDGGAEPAKSVSRYSGDKNYMLHLFTSKSNINIDRSFTGSEKVRELKVFYFGKTVANIGRRDSSGKTTLNPFPVDGVIVWEADDALELKTWLTSHDYQDFLKSNDTNGAYLLRRVL
jgi:uncharacterized protein (DUF1330 family)